MQDIHVTAYSPLGTPPSATAMFKNYQPDLVMDDPVVQELAKKYNKNAGQVQVLLQWVFLTVIPQVAAWRWSSCNGAF